MLIEYPVMTVLAALQSYVERSYAKAEKVRVERIGRIVQPSPLQRLVGAYVSYDEAVKLYESDWTNRVEENAYRTRGRRAERLISALQVTAASGHTVLLSDEDVLRYGLDSMGDTNAEAS